MTDCHYNKKTSLWRQVIVLVYQSAIITRRQVLVKTSSCSCISECRYNKKTGRILFAETLFLDKLIALQILWNTPMPPCLYNRLSFECQTLTNCCHHYHLQNPKYCHLHNRFRCQGISNGRMPNWVEFTRGLSEHRQICYQWGYPI